MSAASGKYIRFKDPEVARICIANWSSDGVGVTKEDAAKVTTSMLKTTFRDNTLIKSFDELKFFTGLTYIYSNGFSGCSNLEALTLPPTVKTLEGGAFLGCIKLATINLKNITSITGNSFQENILSRIEFSDAITNIGNRGFIYTGANRDMTVIIRRASVPTLGSNVFRRYQGSNAVANTLLKIYVPYSADHSVLAAYKAASNWSDYANYIFELDVNGDIPNR